MKRWGARGLVDWTINKEWKTGFSGNYSSTKIKSAPGANSGIMNVVYSAPAEYNLEDTPYHLPGDPSVQTSFRATNFNNPYWWAANNQYGQLTQRFFGNAFVEFRPKIGWGDNLDLVIKEQAGIDAYTSRYSNIQEVGSAGNTTGYIENQSFTRQVFNNLVTANFTAELGENRDWNLGLMLGNEVNNDHLIQSDYIGTGLSSMASPLSATAPRSTMASRRPRRSARSVCSSTPRRHGATWCS